MLQFLSLMLTKKFFKNWDSFSAQNQQILSVIIQVISQKQKKRINQKQKKKINQKQKKKIDQKQKKKM